MSFTTRGDLPRWLDGPGAGGSWKQTPEDFLVEEVPIVEPTGSGEHQWLRIEKVGRGTPEVVAALAKAAGVAPAEVGYAGLKDRDARTVQDFTVHFGTEVDELPAGMRIVSRTRTSRRLRNGQLAGNRFTLHIRGGDLAVATARLERLRATGMPNYYGVQRVGGDAPANGKAILMGGGPRLRFDQLKFALSAYQSQLFNRVLSRRGPRALDGDLLEDGIPTGPMFGPSMRWPTGEALALEEAVLAEQDLPPDAWTRFGKLTQGTRRKLRVDVRAEIEPTEEGFVLRFQLPSGSYATVLLEELL